MAQWLQSHDFCSVERYLFRVCRRGKGMLAKPTDEPTNKQTIGTRAELMLCYGFHKLYQ